MVKFTLKFPLAYRVQLQKQQKYCTPKTAVQSKNPRESLLGLTSIAQQKSSLIGQIEPPSTKMVVAIGLGTSAQLKDFPEAPIPDLCCGSGCPNCVYIQYAEEVLNYVKSLPLHDGIVEKQKKIVRDAMKKNIKDDNLRMFLLMEIESKGF